MMKKHILHIAFVGASFALTSYAYGWQNTIINNTNGEIIATVTYAGAGICSPETRKIAAGQTAFIDSSICCAQNVSIAATTGTAAGKTYSLETPRAGINMTCRSFTVTIENSKQYPSELIGNAVLN